MGVSASRENHAHTNAETNLRIAITVELDATSQLPLLTGVKPKSSTQTCFHAGNDHQFARNVSQLQSLWQYELRVEPRFQVNIAFLLAILCHSQLVSK